LLSEGGASITEANDNGETAFSLAASEGYLALATALLERGGADVWNATKEMIWDLLEPYLIDCPSPMSFPCSVAEEPSDTFAASVTALLRVMVLQGSPSVELVDQLSSEHALVVEQGARLRAGLPAYLAQRRALLDAHCPLIAPLRALVHDYQVPTTTEELWATGPGAGST
jgi:ankyrin repeat protein